MRSVTGQRVVPCAPDVAFAALADFSRCAEWDPGVVRSRRLDEGPVRVGSTFAVDSRFAGTTVPMHYQVLVHKPPTLLVLVGRADWSTATDRIAFEPHPDGTQITWTLELRMRGIARLTEPALGPALNQLATGAMNGLATWSALR